MPTQAEFMTDVSTLSPGAVRVLAALVDSSKGNGHDFGLMCDANKTLGMTDHEFAGHVSHLGRFIEWRENLADDPGVQCNEVQYGLTEETRANGDAIVSLAANAPRPPAENDWTPRTAMGQALKNLTTDQRRQERMAHDAYHDGGPWTSAAHAFGDGFKRGMAILARHIKDYDAAIARDHEYFAKVMTACVPRASVISNDGDTIKDYGSTLTQGQVADIVSESTGIDRDALEWTEASGGLELWVRMPDRSTDHPEG